jgi:hypothetical protein
MPGGNGAPRQSGRRRSKQKMKSWACLKGRRGHPIRAALAGWTALANGPPQTGLQRVTRLRIRLFAKDDPIRSVYWYRAQISRASLSVLAYASGVLRPACGSKPLGTPDFFATTSAKIFCNSCVSP